MSLLVLCTTPFWGLSPFPLGKEGKPFCSEADTQSSGGGFFLITLEEEASP